MRVLSLFSGAGGLDLGLIRAGHDVVWANDIDPDCVATYRHNIGGHIVEGDVSEVDADVLPPAELVVGGFPCQGFSCANMRRSPEDRRNALYLDFVRVVGAVRPNFFIAENVRGILSLDRGRVIQLIVDDFAELGYAVDYRVLNMADYGVPQTRWRVIIIGRRADLPAELHPALPAVSHARAADRRGQLRPWVTIGEALACVPEPGATNDDLLNHVCSQYKVTNRNFTGHRWTDPDKPSPTILARGNGKGGVCAIQHPSNHRRLSVRESAIVQSFPNDFEFFGRLNSMYRQVGNAVPPLFAEKLGQELAMVEAKMVVAA